MSEELHDDHADDLFTFIEHELGIEELTGAPILSYDVERNERGEVVGCRMVYRFANFRQRVLHGVHDVC